MKKINVLLLAFLLLSFWANAQQYPFNGLDMNMGNLSRLSNAQSRSISPENFTGEKGKGAMADPVRDKDECGRPSERFGERLESKSFYYRETGGDSYHRGD